MPIIAPAFQSDAFQRTAFQTALSPSTVPELTPDLHVLATWRPEQFTRCSNPSFATNTTGWVVTAGINAAGTSITRVTSDGPDGDTTCGELVTDDVADSGVNFDLGTDIYYSDAQHATQYVVRVWLRSVSGGRRARIVFGSLGTTADRQSLVITDLSGEWREYAVSWRPSADRTDAEVAIMNGDDQVTTLRIGKVRIYSPLASQADNGYMLTNTQGWFGATGVTATRVTTTPFITGGAAARIDTTGGSDPVDAMAHYLGNRRFVAGRTYRCRLAARWVSGSTTPRLVFGDVGAGDSAILAVTLTSDWQIWTVDWTPAADRIAVVVRIDENSAGSGVWDVTAVDVYEALDEIGPRVLDVTRGAMSGGGDETPAGSTTFEVPDLTGLLDPHNESSTLYGSVTPGVPVLMRAVWDGHQYGVAWGKLRSIDSDPYGEVVMMAAGDGLTDLEGLEVERPFAGSLSFAAARREALLDAGLSAFQLDMSEAGPESDTFFDGADGAQPLVGYLASLNAATGSIHAAEPSAIANVGWVYRTIDRASLTDPVTDFSIIDDSRGPLPGAGMSDDTLVTSVRAAWQGYDVNLPDTCSIDGSVLLPWGSEPAPPGYGVVAIGGDPSRHPNLRPYLTHTNAAFGSADSPDPEEVWTIERTIVRRKGKRIRKQRRRRRLRWTDPIFPMLIPAGETREFVVDFTIPMEDIRVSADYSASTTSLRLSLLGSEYLGTIAPDTPGTFALTIPAGTRAVLVTVSGFPGEVPAVSLGGVPLTCSEPTYGLSARVWYALDISARTTDSLWVSGYTYASTRAVAIVYVGGIDPRVNDEQSGTYTTSGEHLNTHTAPANTSNLIGVSAGDTFYVDSDLDDTPTGHTTLYMNVDPGTGRYAGHYRTAASGANLSIGIKRTGAGEGEFATLSLYEASAGALGLSPRAEVSRATITVEAGLGSMIVHALAVIAKPYQPLAEGESIERSAGLASREQANLDDTYINGPGQAEGLGKYLTWRYGSSRRRPVVTDGLEPVRQLTARIGGAVDLTVARYRIDGLPTIIRGVRHRITRPAPWYTDYALEELPPDAGPWVTLDGGSGVGIDSSAVLAH